VSPRAKSQYEGILHVYNILIMINCIRIVALVFDYLPTLIVIIIKLYLVIVIKIFIRYDKNNKMIKYPCMRILAVATFILKLLNSAIKNCLPTKVQNIILTL